MMRRGWRRLVLAWRSVTGRLAMLGLVFLAVPAILYGRFEKAEADKQQLLLDNLEVQGRLVARLLAPTLERPDGDRLLAAAGAVEALAGDGAEVKLLFRPDPGGSWFYVASTSGGDAAYLDRERRRLLAHGILPQLDRSCAVNWPVVRRFTNPRGGVELLTSATPLRVGQGCWVVITSSSADDLAGTSLARPFAETPAVRLAAALYALMALVAAVTVGSVVVGLRRFAALARQVRGGGRAQHSFAAATRIPELLPVAEEFDRMVATLDASAQAIRDASRENAHAFKVPLGAIVQALEPLRPLAAEGRPAQALETVERAAERLQQLLAAAMRVDEGIADIMNAPRRPVDLSATVRQVVHALSENQGRQVTFATAVAEGVWVRGDADMLETIVENLVDNALAFARPGGFVGVKLESDGEKARLVVEDDGPGVDPANLERIFDRYFTSRPDAPGGHCGIGLWVVRRNAEALGGTAAAENPAEGGFRVTVLLPLDRARPRRRP